ncbi:hypothetical protein SAY86_029261 [Trapa natans]|uniref:Amino acid transporter transmembrane domain-containing protein n=1 Tax=Trapa natans TaxID=22666 RepID=A0AAN7M105_TRANT|nr:hypothetical protein SAY86_029261 [Trapa natans]
MDKRDEGQGIPIAINNSIQHAQGITSTMTAGSKGLVILYIDLLWTLVTASAHIITAVIGSGVLSLSWAIAQLGWAVGVAVLMAFSIISYFTATLLADCYRSPDPITGKRNYTYMDAIRANLGKPTSPTQKVQLCGLAQYGNLIGITIGYTITTSISMVAELRSKCFHKNGHHVKCHISNNPFMLIFACIQIILSQIPNFHKLSWLSYIAAVMSFAYSSIGVALSIAKVAGGAHVRMTLIGLTVGVEVSEAQKVWRTFQAIGNIAFAFGFTVVLVEIQAGYSEVEPTGEQGHEEGIADRDYDRNHLLLIVWVLRLRCLREHCTREHHHGFGFFEPFWLIDLANMCLVVHLVGAYRVFCQPIFGFVENWCSDRWPESDFINREIDVEIPGYGKYNFNLFRLAWRTVYVIITSLVALIFPFFNDFPGLIGSLAFWPLAVYFPVEMHIARKKMKKYSFMWVCLKALSWICLIVSAVAAVGSVQGLFEDLMKYKPF